METETNWNAIIASACVPIVILFFVWLIFFCGNHAVPVSGLVVEKVQASTGYGRDIHTLRVETAPDQYTWITVSARVYLSVAEGVRYEFIGPRGGKSYDSAKVAGE